MAGHRLATEAGPRLRCFWRSGPDGAAGQYSSNAGRRVLTARIKSMLPELDVE